MDIKVGEYVRTNRGNIDKVIIDYNGRCNNSNCNRKHISCKYDYYNEEDITKHSFNIIDLIEVGDIVVMLDTKFNTKDYIFIDDKEMLKAVKEDLKDRCKLLEVLTHEQFEANCYKIKQK